MMFLYLLELHILFEDNPPSPCLDCFVCSSVCFASAGMEPTTIVVLNLCKTKRHTHDKDWEGVESQTVRGL